MELPLLDRAELNVAHTCCLSQSFSWTRLASDRGSLFVSASPFPVVLRQEPFKQLQFASLVGTPEDEARILLRSYFQLDYSVVDLYREWGMSCPRMKQVTDSISGVRVVQQDPWECLMSFICSSNNNVKRIGLMLQRLRCTYGTYICSLTAVDGEWEVSYGSDAPPGDEALDTPSKSRLEAAPVHLYSFPTVDALADATEEDLRALGMGYRAKFIVGTARLVRQVSASLRCSSAVLM